MRVLVVTNYYPPCEHGWGYMQLCEEVTDGLVAKGHDVTVLTSTYRHGDEIPRPYSVHRLLSLNPDWNGRKLGAWQFFWGRQRREKEAISHFRHLVANFHPDVIFIWHYIGLPRVLLTEAETLPGVEVAYYLAGYHPELPDEYIAYWQRPPVHLIAQILKKPLSHLALAQLHREGKPVSPAYKNVICVSKYVRHRLVSQGLISPEAVVIHNGVDLSVFSPKEHRSRNSDTSDLHCLVAGRVTAEKGIHTVIKAFAELKNRTGNTTHIHLTILGDGPADYKALLKGMVQTHQLQSVVEFQSPISRHHMPRKLADYNILILPSEYEEPIARSMQEAMAMGLLVIGTTTGGSGELLAHEQTGLVFEAGNAYSLAQQLQRVMNEPNLASRLAQAGQARVSEEFSIDLTINRIENYLQNLVKEHQ